MKSEVEAENIDATAVFSRSNTTIKDVLAEQKREAQQRAKKKTAKAGKAAELDSPKVKRRRTSEVAEDDDAPLEPKKL